MEEIEMINYEGVCRFCGEVIPCLAVDQEDANLKAEEKCSCGGLEKERRHEKMINNIEITFGGECDTRIFTPVGDEQMEFIKQAAEMVFEDVIASVAFDLYNSKGKILGTTQGNIKIERTLGYKTQLES